LSVGAKAIAEALKKNNTLLELNLSYNKIDDDGAIAIVEALKENSTLLNLILCNNNIGDNGARVIAEAEALKENNSIKLIDLTYNEKISRETKNYITLSFKTREPNIFKIKLYRSQ
jgi:hypothetical protein